MNRSIPNHRDGTRRALSRAWAVAITLGASLVATSALGAIDDCEERVAKWMSRLDARVAACAAKAEDSASFDRIACELRFHERFEKRLASSGCERPAEVEHLGEEAFPGSVGEEHEGWVRLAGAMTWAHYEVIDGEAILEGDIVLGDAAEVAAADQAHREHLASGLASAQSGTRPGFAFGWSNNTIPFEIGGGFSRIMRSRILAAIAHWNERTIVRLRARNGEGSFVRFRSVASGCSSAIGRQGGRQNINVSTGCSTGNIIHEIGHAVGLFHEVSRHDRNSFVDIDFSNVQANRVNNFLQYGLFEGVDRGGYDTGSIMQYGSFFFAIDPTQPTITREDGSLIVAQRTALSRGDIVGVTEMVINRELALTHRFVNEQSGKCMDVSGGSRNSGVSIRQRNCQFSDRQRWIVYRDPISGRDLLINGRSGLCLHAPGNGNVNMVQNPCDRGTDQMFRRQRNNWWENWRLRNVRSNRCVEIANGSNAQNGRVRQRACNGGRNQRWSQGLL